MALTMHFLEADFTMNDWTLEVEPLPGKHTGEAISEALDKTMARWGLNKSLCVRLIRDGAANAVSGAMQLGVPHNSCIAHSLHLVVGGATIKKKRKAANEEIAASTTTATSETNVSGEATVPSEAIVIRETTAARDAIVGGDAIVGDNSADGDDAGEWSFVGSSDEVVIDGNESVNDENLETIIDALREEACVYVDRHVARSLNFEEHQAMEKMRATVQVFRSLASYFSKSPKGKHRFVQIRNDVQRNSKATLLVDCPTRWSSCGDMLSRFLELKITLDKFFVYLTTSAGKEEFERHKLRRPSPRQWFAVRCLLLLLNPFAAATEHLSGSRYPTLSVAFLVLRHIKHELRNEKMFEQEAVLVGEEDYVNPVVEHMHHVRRAMLRLFLDRFSGLDEELLWISYLDPRLSEMALVEADEIARAQQCLIAAAVEIAKKGPPVEPTVENRPTTASPMATPEKAKAKMLSAVFGRRATQSSTPVAHVCAADEVVRKQCASEFLLYLKDANQVAVECNPLEWWRANANRYPILAELARKWLCCVATSVPSERAFSTSGLVVTAKRCSLAPSSVRNNVFIAENT